MKTESFVAHCTCCTETASEGFNNICMMRALTMYPVDRGLLVCAKAVVV